MSAASLKAVLERISDANAFWTEHPKCFNFEDVCPTQNVLLSKVHFFYLRAKKSFGNTWRDDSECHLLPWGASEIFNLNCCRVEGNYGATYIIYTALTFHAKNWLLSSSKAAQVPEDYDLRLVEWTMILLKRISFVGMA